MIHFLISLSIFGLVLAWVWFVAYPDVYFTMAGAVQGLTLVFLVDVVLGPLLSFLVYNPKKPKKEIFSDFAIIGLVQVGALLYGLNTLYQEHPKAVVVYHKSSATVFNKRELDEVANFNLNGDYSKWGELPVAVYSPSVSRQAPYQTLSNSLNIIQETDKITRPSLSADDKATLENLEKTHGKLYVIAVLAKYNGAYFALNQELQLVAKFGEKPIS
ncbi:hypothetical protein [Moraxella oblonga]|uniref:hypothetical protein n=1 Tax=Moraxella oblonga TaxID=200413 RepID=UPI0014705C6B|nr:hypothetical protein [Moraxella oblonga]